MSIFIGMWGYSGEVGEVGLGLIHLAICELSLSSLRLGYGG